MEVVEHVHILVLLIMKHHIHMAQVYQYMMVVEEMDILLDGAELVGGPALQMDAARVVAVDMMTHLLKIVQCVMVVQ